MLDRDREHRYRADRRSGEIVAILFNTNVDPKKHPRGISWLDVYPEWKEPEPVESEEKMLNTMLLWARVTAPKQIGGGPST